MKLVGMDASYVLFILLLSWWLVISECGSPDRLMQAKMILSATTISGLGLLYAIKGSGIASIFTLIPVVMWVFFSGQSLFR